MDPGSHRPPLHGGMPDIYIYIYIYIYNSSRPCHRRARRRHQLCQARSLRPYRRLRSHPPFRNPRRSLHQCQPSRRIPCNGGSQLSMSGTRLCPGTEGCTHASRMCLYSLWPQTHSDSTFQRVHLYRFVWAGTVGATRLGAAMVRAAHGEQLMAHLNWINRYTFQECVEKFGSTMFQIRAKSVPNSFQERVQVHVKNVPNPCPECAKFKTTMCQLHDNNVSSSSQECVKLHFKNVTNSCQERVKFMLRTYQILFNNPPNS